MSLPAPGSVPPAPVAAACPAEEVLDLPGGAFGLLAPGRAPARGVGVVLFNAGLIHRPGPLRLHVDLARRLAGAGFDVLRFDLPGIGDTPSGDDAMSAAVAALDAVAARTGATSFVVGGVCSAADLGWRMAMADDRVRGLLLIDPFAVRNGWYHVGRLRAALRLPPRELLRKLRGRIRRGRREPVPLAGDYRDWPDPAGFRQQLAGMLARGVRVFALYTGGVGDYLLHGRQLVATFGASRRHPGLELEFRPWLDHILFAARDRADVVDAISNWVAAVDRTGHASGHATGFDRHGPGGRCGMRSA